MRKVVLDCTDSQADQVVVDKNNSKVYFVQGHGLELIAHVHSRTSITWAEGVDESIRERARTLLG